MKPIIKFALRCVAALAALWASLPLAAQEYEYVPLVREGVKWEYSYFYTVTDDGEMFIPEESYVSYTMEFRGDTIIGGFTYKKLQVSFLGKDYVTDYMREENKRVYWIKNQEYSFHDDVLRMNWPYYSVPSENFESTGERLVYDFNDMNNVMPSYSTYFTYFTEEYVEIGGKLRKKFLFNRNPYYFIIEGVGGDGPTFGRMPYNGIYLPPICICNYTSNLRRMIGSDGKTEYTNWPHLFSGIEANAGKVDAQVSGADGAVLVKLSRPTAMGMIAVIDASGRVVCSLVCDGRQDYTIADLPPGIYVVQYSDGQRRATHKVKL